MEISSKNQFKAKAPLRISLAGGGSDIPPFSCIYGGHVLNMTIKLFCYATLEPLNNGKIIFESLNLNSSQEFISTNKFNTDDDFKLLKGVYNRIISDFNVKDDSLSFKLTTYADVPIGSGLGTSSSLVVAIIACFAEWLKIPLTKYDISNLAYKIEREDLNLSGGKQDQYASVFGGINFMEFYENKSVVTPLDIKSNFLKKLESSIFIFYTGKSRNSENIIEIQKDNILTNKGNEINITKSMKKGATLIKEALFKENINDIGDILHRMWLDKKKVASSISNNYIDKIYESGLKAGIRGGKISGAGGGGFFIFCCPITKRLEVEKALKEFDGEILNIELYLGGVKAWSVN